ncbi:hypothetical protein BDZ45DRAFT_684856 [Acephala macrosclerotiorum]|nr:hypothetical protein BDZ45DRAFT_684856 [Acephala macrosclerotiorum]
MGNVLPSPVPPLQQPVIEPDMNFTVTTPLPALPAPKTRRQSSSKSRVSKRSGSKRKGETVAASPRSRNRGSRETSALMDDNDAYDTSTTISSPGVQEPGYAYQQTTQGSPYETQPVQQPGSYVPSTGQQYPPMQIQNEYMQYQGTGYGHGPPPQQYQSGPQNYSSRIEDVTRRQDDDGGDDGRSEGRLEVRSQYIVATQDSVWRVAP